MHIAAPPSTPLIEFLAAKHKWFPQSECGHGCQGGIRPSPVEVIDEPPPFLLVNNSLQGMSFHAPLNLSPGYVNGHRYRATALVQHGGGHFTSIVRQGDAWFYYYMDDLKPCESPERVVFDSITPVVFMCYVRE